MKKVLSVALFLLLGFIAMGAQNIGHIERQGSWYNIYDQSGKKVGTFSASQGELAGYSSQIYILKSGSWYNIYGADRRKEKTMSVSSVGDIINVAGDTFTSRQGSWIYTWNRQGKKISTRAAH